MDAAGLLPDPRDGLTTAGRRALCVLHARRLHSPMYVKSSQIVEDVRRAAGARGSRAAIYARLVHMTRDWELRHPLVEGQGNFGSVDSDPPAEARYTELRLGPVGRELLHGIDDAAAAPATVTAGAFPAVLPARFPSMLVNGSFASEPGSPASIPPHNLRETVSALLAYLDDPAIDVAGLMRHLPGPDFPTGGVVVDHDALRAAYTSGRGKLVVRGAAHVGRGRDYEETIHTPSGYADPPLDPATVTGARAIVVTKLPFGVTKGGRGGIVAEIRRAVRSGQLRGIGDVDDLSSERAGMRLMLGLRRHADAAALLDALYAHTRLQMTFALHLVAMVDGVARTLTLRDLVAHYVEHRRGVVARRNPGLPAQSIQAIVRGELQVVAARYGDERRTALD